MSLAAEIAGVRYPLDTADEIRAAQRALAVDGRSVAAPVYRDGVRDESADDGDAIRGGALYAGRWRGRRTADAVCVEEVSCG